MLYEAEIDHGRAYSCINVTNTLVFCGGIVPVLAAQGISYVLGYFTCDSICCWLRKEYSTRTYFRVYSNRIEINEPQIRCPFGCLGCGSWNADNIKAHPFDRGAFGFSAVRNGTPHHPCCCWPIYGGVVARHRCQCNGPLWNRMCTDCGKCLFHVVGL